VAPPLVLPLVPEVLQAEALRSRHAGRPGRRRIVQALGPCQDVATLFRQLQRFARIIVFWSPGGVTTEETLATPAER